MTNKIINPDFQFTDADTTSEGNSQHPVRKFEGDYLNDAIDLAADYGMFDQHMRTRVASKLINKTEIDEMEKLWMKEHPEIVYLAAGRVLIQLQQQYRELFKD